jgi:hypothetical protein
MMRGLLDALAAGEAAARTLLMLSAALLLLTLAVSIILHGGRIPLDGAFMHGGHVDTTHW